MKIMRPDLQHAIYHLLFCNIVPKVRNVRIIYMCACFVNYTDQDVKSVDMGRPNQTANLELLDR